MGVSALAAEPFERNIADGPYIVEISELEDTEVEQKLVEDSDKEKAGKTAEPSDEEKADKPAEPSDEEKAEKTEESSDEEEAKKNEEPSDEEDILTSIHSTAAYATVSPRIQRSPTQCITTLPKLRCQV